MKTLSRATIGTLLFVTSLIFLIPTHDVAADLPGTPSLFSVGFAGVTIHSGDTKFKSDFNAIAPERDWRYDFFWPNAVTNSSALFALVRGTFGAMEGGPAVAGGNYVYNFQQFGAGTSTVIETMGGNEYEATFNGITYFNHVSMLAHPSTTPSVYTAIVAGLSVPNDVQGAMDWFASGGVAGHAPGAYATLQFQFGSTTPATTTPPTLAFSAEPNFASAHGVYPERGVALSGQGNASSTLYTFKIVYTDPLNAPISGINLVVGGATSTAVYAMHVDTPLDITLSNGSLADGEQYSFTQNFPIGDYQYHFEVTRASSIQPVRIFPDPPAPDLTFRAGFSNVAFLPGIEASRLYHTTVLVGDHNQLWEPNRPADVEKLYLNPDGSSIDSTVYTQDIIDESNLIAPLPILFGYNIYKKFEISMNQMVSDGYLREWEPLPYDWRLDLKTLSERGVRLSNGNISYLNVLSSGQRPFLVSELQRLASTSPTGKVTIIAHSNGGLLAKVLVQKLENEGYHNLIDKMIFVDVPQLGTPTAIAGLLHGDHQEIPEKLGILVSRQNSRSLGENMAPAYNLLPFPEYFNRVIDPVVVFDPNAAETLPYRTLYGTTSITSPLLMDRFISADNGVRTKPVASDTDTPNVVNSELLATSLVTQNMLQNWRAPVGVEIIQVAGWGLDTIKSIKYTHTSSLCAIPFIPEKLSCLFDRVPLFTSDGDGTIVIPSQVADTSVRTYYVDLHKHNSELATLRINRSHADILEVSPLQELIKNLLINVNTSLLQDISISEPVPTINDKRVRLSVHSPVSIEVTDSFGNRTGLVNSTSSSFTSIDQQIPNSYYMEFGEGKYLGLGGGNTYALNLKGTSAGSFTFNIDQVIGDSVVSSVEYKDVPVTASTTVQLTILPNGTTTALTIDANGDGITDATLQSGQAVSVKTQLVLLEKVIQSMQIKKWLKDLLIIQVRIAEGLVDANKKVPANAVLKSIEYVLTQESGKGISVQDVQILKDILGKIELRLV